MAKVRNWHVIEGRAAVHELQPPSVAFTKRSINIILRDKNGKKMNVILDRDEAATLVYRLTAGINKIY